MRLFGKTQDRDDDRRGGGDKLLGKLARLARRLSFLSFGCVPLLLVWQAIGWVEVHYWAEVSIGSIFNPDPDTRGFDAGRLRPIKDLLWIPLWAEFIVLGVALFVLHMFLVSMLETRRQARRKTRRSTPGYKPGSRRRRTDNQ
jgi:hypothetical protein